MYDENLRVIQGQFGSWPLPERLQKALFESGVPCRAPHDAGRVRRPVHVRLPGEGPAERAEADAVFPNGQCRGVQAVALCGDLLRKNRAIRGDPMSEAITKACAARYDAWCAWFRENVPESATLDGVAAILNDAWKGEP